MAIGLKSPGIHHLALRSANLERSRCFYVETLGKRYVAFKDPDRIAWKVYLA